MLPSFIVFVLLLLLLMSGAANLFLVQLFSFMTTQQHDWQSMLLCAHIFNIYTIQHFHIIVRQTNFFCNPQENIFWGSYHIISSGEKIAIHPMPHSYQYLMFFIYETSLKEIYHIACITINNYYDQFCYNIKLSFFYKVNRNWIA